MAKTSANWHYYNKNGEKVGPISVTALRALVQQGLITRETMIVNHTGRTAIAGEVRGLTFPETTPLVAPPEPTIPPAPSMLLNKSDLLTVAPSANGDVYGFSSQQPAMTPPTNPLVQPFAVSTDEPNPFAATLPIESNPFSANPFASPATANPFSTTVPQPVSQRVSVPLKNTPKTLPKPVVFGGVAAVLVLLLIGGVWMMSSSSSPRFSAEEQAEIDKFCAEYGTDVKATDEHGTTLLHRASAIGNVVVVKYLISKGANVKAKGLHDWTPLHYAARDNNNLEVLKYLVSKRADVNARNARGRTPLHAVLLKGGGNVEDVKHRIEFLKYLVAQGADHNAKDNNDMTPLDYAREGGDKNVIEYLAGLK